MSEGPAAHEHDVRDGWLARLLLVALSLFAARAIVRAVGRLDWAAVWDALGQLHWWQAGALIVGLLVRQTLNALPVAIYIRSREG